MKRNAIILTVVGVIIGAIVGYIYYAEIGCLIGTSAITSKPFNSNLHDGVMGGFLLNMFVKYPKR